MVKNYGRSVPLKPGVARERGRRQTDRLFVNLVHVLGHTGHVDEQFVDSDQLFHAHVVAMDRFARWLPDQPQQSSALEKQARIYQSLFVFSCDLGLF